jgi:hypothetical protein
MISPSGIIRPPMMTLSPEDFSSGPVGLNKCPRCDEMKYIRSTDLCTRCCEEQNEMVMNIVNSLELEIAERVTKSKD